MLNLIENKININTQFHDHGGLCNIVVPYGWSGHPSVSVFQYMTDDVQTHARPDHSFSQEASLPLTENTCLLLKRLTQTVNICRGA